MSVDQNFIDYLIDLDLFLKVFPSQKSNNDASKVQPLSFIDEIVNNEGVGLEPLSDEGLEKGNDVEKVQSGIKLNQDVTEIEAANITDALEKHFDVFTCRLLLFDTGMKDILELFVMISSGLFLFNVEIQRHLKRVIPVLLKGRLNPLLAHLLISNAHA